MTKRRKPRRRFSKEFKREAVKLLRDSGKGITQIANELGVTPSVLRTWVDMVEAEEKTGLTPDTTKSDGWLKDVVTHAGSQTWFGRKRES